MNERLQEPEIKKALADIEVPNIFSFLSNIWLLNEQVENLEKASLLLQTTIRLSSFISIWVR